MKKTEDLMFEGIRSSLLRHMNLLLAGAWTLNTNTYVIANVFRAENYSAEWSICRWQSCGSYLVQSMTKMTASHPLAKCSLSQLMPTVAKEKSHCKQESHSLRFPLPWFWKNSSRTNFETPRLSGSKVNFQVGVSQRSTSTLVPSHAS